MIDMLMANFFVPQLNDPSRQRSACYALAVDGKFNHWLLELGFVPNPYTPKYLQWRSSKSWIENPYEKQKRYVERHRRMVNRKRRDKYRGDSAYRERQRVRARQTWAANKDRINAARRVKRKLKKEGEKNAKS